MWFEIMFKLKICQILVILLVLNIEQFFPGLSFRQKILRTISDVRKKFCRVFSTVMTEIAEQLGTTESVRAMAQFSQEQPNFQKLMTEVYYTTEDSYRFFITMATRCTDLIERFLLSKYVYLRLSFDKDKLCV